jgi:CRP/FNR family transcriptional regulator, dissimilatory nitrate respiration regulator
MVHLAHVVLMVVVLRGGKACGKHNGGRNHDGEKCAHGEFSWVSWVSIDEGRAAAYDLDHMAIIKKEPKSPARPTLDWKSLAPESPLLAALPESARRLTQSLEIQRQGAVFGRGDRPQAMFFVLSGEVRLLRRSRSGGEIVLQRTRRGFLAEASLDQPNYHCDAVAAEPTRLLVIPRKGFTDALAVTAFRDRWIAHLARELRKVRAHTERLSLKTARERIVHFIETEGDAGVVDLNQSKKDWAAELGLTHEALYRTLAEMEKRGELTLGKSRLTLR